MSRYTIDGRPVPSVTEILSSVLGNPYQGLPDAEFYMERGQAVHACAALIAKKKEFDHDPKIDGQVSAIRLFFSTIKPVVIAVEQRVESRLYQYAGTLDMVAMIDGTMTIIDWKSSLLPTMALQLAGYAIAWEEIGGAKIKAGYGVEIRADGQYRMTEKYNLQIERREFLALRTVAGIREKYKLGVNNGK
jgi:hypothetical protein